MIYIVLGLVSVRVPCPSPALRVKFLLTVPLSVGLQCPVLWILLANWLSVLSVKNHVLGGPKEWSLCLWKTPKIQQLENSWVLMQKEQLTAEVWEFQLLELWLINILGIYFRWSKSNSIMKHERNPFCSSVKAVAGTP